LKIVANYALEFKNPSKNYFVGYFNSQPQITERSWREADATIIQRAMGLP
jgi:hypothetical protein